MTNDRKRIFISSVQKELELERAALAALIATDPFLLQHFSAVLFESEPPPLHPAPRPYLDCLRRCSVYVLLLANEYGTLDGERSAIHHEYRLAQELKLPTVVFLKGQWDDARSPGTLDLIAEIKAAGHTYKRFHDREDLRPEMLRALLRVLAEEFGVKAPMGALSEGEHLIEVASAFETVVLRDVPVSCLDQGLATTFSDRIGASGSLHPPFAETLHARGLAVRDAAPGVFHSTAGAFILFGSHPANRFPQCEILVDAYDEARITGRPKGQINVNAALPRAIDQVLKFIDDHTFHPRRVVGLNNIRLDEYPAAALREALLNAVAHRSYEDASRKILVQVFSDRLEIASPGYPLKPLTLAKLKRGGYRPCSRNPLIAQTLAVFDKMEQRGSGIARMHDALLDHGLEEPRFELQDGYFVVTFPGPNGDYDRIKTPAAPAGAIGPALEARLSKRQREMLLALAHGTVLTSKWCQSTFKISAPVAYGDFHVLMEEGLIVRIGSGRSTRYILPNH